eukprot:TRINITY_DN1539_c0_g1_i1.p2 TRINITY_DN1539_c0_g1~~TRINITY_DN1539_c0_g1_i1.p2  ORF type:complete len:128 (+),score=33.44 TRINITY_DN1539_c0_g1_i1:44-385(+)
MANMSNESLYKILREGEVVAYHHIIRALVMRNGPNLEGISAEMLRDVRELLHIPEDRHEAEMKAALLSPDVLAAVSTPSIRKRAHPDYDITMAHDSDSTEDDDRPPVKRTRIA